MKKKLHIILSLMMVLGLISAAQLFAGGSSQAAQAVADGPTPISILTPYWSAEIPEDTSIFQKLEQMTNTKLNVEWVPSTAYPEKAALVIASQDLPEVLASYNSIWKSQFIVEAVRAGMFWEIGPMLNNYPNFMQQIDPIIWDYSKYDGKVYGIPRQILKRDGNLIMRLDWLDNLGLKMPQTTDELYNVLKAFTTGDPTKTGRTDTFGMAMNGLTCLNIILMSYGMTPSWYEDKDMQILPPFYQDNYMDALKFAKRIYDDGFVNKDFMATNAGNVLQSFFQGKAGMVQGWVGQISDGAYDAVYTNSPQARIGTLAAFKGPDGVLSTFANPGFNCQYMIPKPSVKSQDKVAKILEFFNRTMDQDVFDLFVKGIEGIHYKMDGDQTVIIDQPRLTKDLAPMLSLYVRCQILESLKISSKEGRRAGYDFQFQDLRDYQQMDAFFITAIPTAQLNQIMNDANTKFVTGDINEAQWRDALDSWKKTGGTALIADYTDQNKKLRH
ncbi:MAG: extracellular solute-binding protein [Treponema sp.]|nr:extracellular solute-binding protein [Treponema sp.]